MKNGEHSDRFLHADVTKAIMACAYRVHSRLGPGLFEKPYKECLYYELRRDKIRFETEKILPIQYDDLIISIGYKIDLLVEDVVIVEIKSVENILPVHEQQLLTYLRLADKSVGLLINFNVTWLKYGIKRRANFEGSTGRRAATPGEKDPS